MARAPSVANRVQWNSGFEAARTNYRLMSWLCLGKHSPGQKHFNQYSVTEKYVRCGLMFEPLTEGGVHKKASPHMLAEVIRRLQKSRTEPTKTTLEEALNIVKLEVKLGRAFPTQELDVGFSPKTHLKTKHAETVPVTPKTATHHNIGDAEFGSPERPGQDESWHSVEHTQERPRCTC